MKAQTILPSPLVLQSLLWRSTDMQASMRSCWWLQGLHWELSGNMVQNIHDSPALAF